MRTIAVISMLLLVAAGQQPNRGTSASIAGHVLGEGGNPIVNARVLVADVEGRSERFYATRTNHIGEFSVLEIRPGDYKIVAEADGYIRAEYGQSHPDNPGSAINLTESNGLSIQLTLERASSIRGRISSQVGLPMSDVSVLLLAWRYHFGERRLQLASQSTTDDRGNYAFGDLSAREYFVAAIPRFKPDPFSSEMLLPVYFPGSPDPAVARGITLVPGETRDLPDLQVIQTRAVHVRGRFVDGLTNQPVTDIRSGVSLVHAGPILNDSLRLSPPPLTINAGAFQFTHVPTGKYLLIVNSTARVATVPVEVRNNTSIEDVIVVLQPTVRISGRIVINDRVFTESELSNLFVAARGTRTGQGPVSSNRRFELSVPLGEYVLELINPPVNAFIESARFGESDPLTTGLHVNSREAVPELVISIARGSAVLEGTVRGNDGEPSRGATVVLVPDGSKRNRRDRFRNTTTNAIGQFAFEAVAEGEYAAFAWTAIEPHAWENAEYLASIEGLGTQIKLRSGDTASVSLRSISPR